MLFTRWRNVVLEFEGISVPMQLRAPNVADGREIHRKAQAWRRAMLAAVSQNVEYIQSKTEAEPDDTAAVFEATFGEAWARGCFERNVRLKEGLVDDDGGRIEGGAALFDVMGVGERVGVLYKLDDMAFLKSTEGKASPSRSTSSADTGTSGSASTATPTEPGDGPAH